MNMEKAKAAIEELQAEGIAITARAVRERAGVAMSVAAEAAREANAEAEKADQVPEISDKLQRRFAAIWGEAVREAREEHAAEREGWRSQLAEANDAADAYKTEAAEAHDQEHAERERAEALLAELERYRDAVQNYERELAVAMERVKGLEGERDRLTGLLKALTPESAATADESH